MHAPLRLGAATPLRYPTTPARTPTRLRPRPVGNRLRRQMPAQTHVPDRRHNARPAPRLSNRPATGLRLLDSLRPPATSGVPSRTSNTGHHTPTQQTRLAPGSTTRPSTGLHPTRGATARNHSGTATTASMPGQPTAPQGYAQTGISTVRGSPRGRPPHRHTPTNSDQTGPEPGTDTTRPDNSDQAGRRPGRPTRHNTESRTSAGTQQQGGPQEKTGLGSGTGSATGRQQTGAVRLGHQQAGRCGVGKGADDAVAGSVPRGQRRGKAGCRCRRSEQGWWGDGGRSRRVVCRVGPLGDGAGERLTGGWCGGEFAGAQSWWLAYWRHV